MRDNYIAYTILTNEQLIIEYYSGHITLNDLIQIKKQISLEDNYNPAFNLIMDLRNTTFVFCRNDVEEFIRFFRSYSAILGKRKVAYLTANPNEVVSTKIFSEKIKDLEISTSTFTTVEATTEWIALKDFDSEKLENIIFKLKSKK